MKASRKSLLALTTLTLLTVASIASDQDLSLKLEHEIVSIQPVEADGEPFAPGRILDTRETTYFEIIVEREISTIDEILTEQLIDGLQIGEKSVKLTKSNTRLTNERGRSVLFLTIQPEDWIRDDGASHELAALIRKATRAHRFDPVIVTQIEHFSNQAEAADEKAGFNVLLAGHQSLPGSPVPADIVRKQLQEIARKHPDSWVSAFAKLTLLGSRRRDASPQERIELLHSILTDRGLDELENIQNPFTGLLRENSFGAPADYVTFSLAAVYVQISDLPNAEKTIEAIRSEFWRERADQMMVRARQDTREEQTARRYR